MKGLERGFEEVLQEISSEVEENDINFELDRRGIEVENVIPWDYPPKPSRRARAIIEELIKMVRYEQIDILGPIIELPEGKCDFIDISFIFQNGSSENLTKWAFEIDDEIHDLPRQQLKDIRKNKRLEKKGWRVVRFHHSICDLLGPREIAKKIIRIIINDGKDLGYEH